MSLFQFHSQEVDFVLRGHQSQALWLEALVRHEGFEPGPVNLIFTSDEALLRTNQQFLQHDFYTDIITFDYGTEARVSGDLFISIDRVADNARQLGLPFDDELARVMAHGVLHLCGYGDKTPAEEKAMRAKEDFYLDLKVRNE